MSWLRKKESTNFDMILTLVTFVVTCVGAGVVCFYLGVKATCIGTTSSHREEAFCVVQTIDRVVGKSDYESVSSSVIYSLIPLGGDS